MGALRRCSYGAHVKVYLVAAARAARLPPPFSEAVRSCAELVLFRECGPWHFRQWTSSDGRTQLLVWCNEPEDERLLPPLLADGQRALGCPGYLGDGRDVERLLRTEDLGALADQLPGVFGAFRAHQHGFEAVTTVTRFHPVYQAAAGEVQLAGNRALLVHLVERVLAHPSPIDAAPAVRYDIPALQSLVRNGFFMSDDTPFEGVQALPAHSTLEVLRDQRRIIRRPLPEPQPNGGRRSARAGRRLVRDLADSVVKAVAPLRAFSEPITLQLTGGRDSRLIAAALHAADIPFRAVTSGFRKHPDVALAARISDLLGTPHKIMTPRKEPNGDDLIVEHPLQRAWEIIRATEGMVAVHNTVRSPLPFNTSPTIAGWGGEQLRGGYLAMVFKKSSGTPSPSAMRKKVNGLFTGLAGFLTDAANERAGSDLASWIDLPDADPAQILDRVYLYCRTGRWASALGAARWASVNPINPLLDNLVSRFSLGIPPFVRLSEQPVHEVISRLAPQLRNLPLVGTRWRYDMQKPRWPARRGWSSRFALTVGNEHTGFDWRYQPSPRLIETLREQIMDGPSQLFDIVKRSEMEALLSTYPLQSPKFVWYAYTASALLSSVWLSERPARSPIMIRPPTLHATSSAGGEPC
jgi:asparagine synthetase B (glutamine-hydrolysing)